MAAVAQKAAPLIATPSSMEAMEVELPRYEVAPEQSTWRVMSVLMRKHLILGLRRRRLVGVIFRVGFTVGIPILMWFTTDERGHRYLRGMLVSELLPVLATMMILAMFTQFVVEVVTDKELKMRYVQQVAGVSDTAYWLSYYLYYALLTTLATLLFQLSTTIIAPLYKHSNSFLIFLFFSLAFLQAFFACIMVATICSRARMAGVVCSIMSGIMVAVKYVVLPQISTTSFAAYLAQSLIPFVSPLNLFDAIGILETRYIFGGEDRQNPGFTWSSFYEPISGVDRQTGQQRIQPSAGVQFQILLMDCLIYGLFAIWFDQVHQGEFGAAKPLLFCCDPAHVCPRRAGDNVRDVHAPALQLADLVKRFGSHRAVDGMSLEVRRAEIFALLGHNGAGKTTAINCITGMLPITSGSVTVCGVDVATELQEARRHLSVCPQDNPLYLEYTCEDHLQFFAALRGVTASAAEVAIRDSLQALGLVEKRHARVSTLSGGQKRRLWVATSLLGETPLVFLDEPTSGMDPANRRKLWDLLVRMKSAGRCILFTTHYLDEADVLAERKAVLDKGMVKAVGTSQQLKRQFGLGYHLRVIGVPGASSAGRDAVGTVVRSHISSATDEAVPDEDRAQARDAPTTWSFILPFDGLDKFGPMLMELETRAQELQVTDFSVETTTLEEVFMALGRTSEGAADTEDPTASAHGTSGVDHLVGPQERVPATWLTSLRAVFVLRGRQALQQPRSLLTTMFVPMVLLVGQGVLLSTQAKKIEEVQDALARSQALAMTGTLVGLPMTISLAIALPYFATAAVLDRVQRCLYVATSQGLRLSAYWVGTFLNNYLHFLLLGFAMPVTVLALECPFFSESDTLWSFVPAVLLSPVPMLLFAYSSSRMFSSAEASSKFMPSITLLAAMVPFLAVFILTLVSLSMQLMSVHRLHRYPGDRDTFDIGKSLNGWRNAIHWIMCFIDPFYLLPGTFAALGLSQIRGFVELFNLQLVQANVQLDILFPQIGDICVAPPLLGATVLSLVLAFLSAWDAQRSWAAISCALRGPRANSQPAPQEAEHSSSARPSFQSRLSYVQDADVLQEQRQVASADAADYAVTYKNLIQTYNKGTSREVRAVRGISLGVARGECFCLLGPNGAGKTTTLDVLTGAIFPPTQGEVWIGGHSTTRSREECYAALKNLGNCPQVDPLWPTLTGRQHLLFYAKIKGVPSRLCQHHASATLHALGFSDFDADKPTQGYSGGMKRKLSLAIALIGSPPTMLLDEPSAAVDAAAKRHLWRVVKRREPGQTVMLTTHSMEEAEALSDRLAIQVKGRLRCLGTPDHLKMTYGAGYQLELFTSKKPESVEAFVLELCPSARLMEFHEGRFLFQLPVLKAVGTQPGELSLAVLFLKMQEATESIGLRDYSITRPSLEQVFLRLSKEQEELDAGSRAEV